VSQFPELLQGTISDGHLAIMQSAWLAHESEHPKKTHGGTECTNRGGPCQIEPTCDQTVPDCSVDQPTCGGTKPDYKAFQPVVRGWSMPPELPLR
jgi:hypothetical protein